MFIQVLCKTKFGNFLSWPSEAGVPDHYGNGNEVVVFEGADGPYSHVFFS